MSDSQVKFKGSTFQVGDKVKHIILDDYYIIEAIDGRHVRLKDCIGLYDANAFKLVEENMNKQFTKDDLVAGKHVVQTKDSEERLYLLANIGKDVMAFEVDGATNPFCGVWFEDLKNDLTYPHNHDFDVLKVFEFEGSAKFGVSVESLKLIWQREEKSQSQIELEKLQKQISELQTQAKRLEKSL